MGRDSRYDDADVDVYHMCSNIDANISYESRDFDDNIAHECRNIGGDPSFVHTLD